MPEKCPVCQHSAECIDDMPPLNATAAWERLVEQHAIDCEWIWANAPEDVLDRWRAAHSRLGRPIIFPTTAAKSGCEAQAAV